MTIEESASFGYLSVDAYEVDGIALSGLVSDDVFSLQWVIWWRYNLNARLTTDFHRTACFCMEKCMR